MPKELPLAQFHRANGAEFFERDGWSLPRHFGNPEVEYRSARFRVALKDSSDRALLEFRGPDRFSFLQGMVSNDLRGLEAGHGIYAAFLNQQGKVLGDARILVLEDSFIVDLWEPLKEKIQNHLARYLVADEVEIIDATASWAALSLLGPESAAVLRRLAQVAELPAVPLAHSAVRLRDAGVRLLRRSEREMDGYDILTAREDLLRLARLLTEEVRALSSSPWIGEEAAEILRLEAGIPRYGADFGDDTLLLETGLERAVSFTKGCYLGQEVVERVRSRGHVNRKLVGLRLEESCLPGDKLFAGGKEVGAVTSCAFSPALGKNLALGYVQRDYWSAGTSLKAARGPRLVGAIVTELPLTASETTAPFA
ncbi:MAG TPA: glycine cleavage T C-terminal barrel domain-containing protein [candidate division Zixibacteria bacterium]|nr:glycine cleavage T C-terminal barrel domain-containing protein [candidate division Zixibacteria bacterium]